MKKIILQYGMMCDIVVEIVAAVEWFVVEIVVVLVISPVENVMDAVISPVVNVEVLRK